MIKTLGGILLAGNLFCFTILSFAEVEPSLHTTIGVSAGLIAGAILIAGGSK